MKQHSRTIRGLALAATAVLLLAAPAAAQDIPAGPDTWATTASGTTYIELTSADWQAICGAAGGSLQIQFKGIALRGQGDGSVVVTRFANADLTTSSVAYVPVKVTTLGFASVSSYGTPCGNLNFRVGLNGGQQTATMRIEREGSWGGHFFVDLPVDAVVTAINASTGATVGSVLKEGVLLEPSGGTVWSYTPAANPLDPNAPWHPGVNQAGQPVTISRYHQEILAAHAYKPVTYCGGAVIGTKATASPSPSPCPAEPVEPAVLD